MSLSIRPVRPADCAPIAEFRLRVEGGGYLASVRGKAFYERKYLGWGRALVLEEAGRIAGTISAIPKRVRIGSEELRAADLGDLFVDPALRGRGLFRRLHDDLVGQLEQDGVRMLTVRPGPASRPILQRAFGYATLLPVKEWIAALDESGVRALPLGRSPLRRTLPRIPDHLPPAPADAITHSTVPADLHPPNPFGATWPTAGTVRDAAWLQHRYAEDPAPYRMTILQRDGGMGGVVVCLVVREAKGNPVRGWLVDAWTDPAARDVAGSLAAAALTDLRRQGASLVHFWSAQGPRRSVDPMVNALRALGLRGVSRGTRVLYRLIGNEPAPRIARAQDWMFRIGDTDGI